MSTKITKEQRLSQLRAVIGEHERWGERGNAYINTLEHDRILNMTPQQADQYLNPMHKKESSEGANKGFFLKIIN